MDKSLLKTQLPTDGQAKWGQVYNTAIENLRLFAGALSDNFGNHNHPISAIVGLQNTLTSLQNTLNSHLHAIADVEGLQAELNGKSATNHRHLLGDINELDTAFHTVHQNFESNLSEILKLQAQMSDHQHSIAQVNDLQAVIDEIVQRIAIIDPHLIATSIGVNATNLQGMIGVSPVVTPMNIHINKVEYRFRRNGAIVHVAEVTGLLGLMIPISELGIPHDTKSHQLQIQIAVYTPHAFIESGWKSHTYQWYIFFPHENDKFEALNERLDILENMFFSLSSNLDGVSVNVKAQNLYSTITCSTTLSRFTANVNRVEYRFRRNGTIVHMVESSGFNTQIIPVDVLGIPPGTAQHQLQIQVAVFTPNSSVESGWINHTYQMQNSAIDRHIEAYFEQNIMSKLNAITPAVIAEEIANNKTAISMISDELAFNRNFTNGVAIIQR